MTKQSEVIDNEKYTACLDHGFVGLIDYMGSDDDIANAARVSYGEGTRSISDNRALIRYLVKHHHVSPIEMTAIKLHLKLPIFVMRQLVRHRMSNLNECSGRYSIMSDEFYIPELENIKPQSKDNKQGRAGEFEAEQQKYFQSRIKYTCDSNYQTYLELLGDNTEAGVARELARTILPVSNYTELYWKQDLRNMLHMLKLRRDSHAQYEIRVYADAIYNIIKPLFPITCEAWEDYSWNAVTISQMETKLLKILTRYGHSHLLEIISLQGEENFAKNNGMSKRELKEFMKLWLDKETA